MTSTPEMSALVEQFTERPVAVVTDPFEGPRGVSRFSPPARRSRSGFRRWLGDSIVEGLRWALEHPDEAQRRVLAGEAFVAATYSPEAVASASESALAHLPDGRS